MPNYLGCVCKTIILIYSDLLETENKPDEPEVIHKAKDYYKACANEG